MSTEQQQSEQILSAARASITLQQSALERTSQHLGNEFVKAVGLIAKAPKVVTTGLGKSGFIAKKLAATLSSIRIPSLFLHPVDALHGDSGILDPSDVLIAFSKSGETVEMIRLVDLAKSMNISVVTITSRGNSTLALQADAALLALVDREFDEMDVLPTASTTSALVVADLLAVAAATLRGGVATGLRSSHPQGTIGTTLLRTVDEVMHSGDRIPRVRESASMTDALAELTVKGLGIVCIEDASQQLVGIITDGDVRRAMSRGANVSTVKIQEVMTRNPLFISPVATLHEALTLMERRERQIGVVPVVTNGHCVGIIRVHDIVRANL
jgi:arabinose-5-phosphate isomerase